ncbi:protein Wnt-8b-like isoform X1 [Parasteatoda tepidariorum]|uniref:protein Wnt-8b-like isoform X1 n=1 Tax=Parasteatoda tepidariorum TaxID=114398 RepID=UPI00077F83F0|nr:protein Wnt-8b-like isoform X1 [Parasteatoda tepidariorum]
MRIFKLNVIITEVIIASLGILVESAAWSLSNIMMSGSKAVDIYADSVAIAAERGMEECRNQFRWEPWGCPKESYNVFLRSQKYPATKEMAFIHAMISASIVITLTRNCSLGHFNSCGCDETKKGPLGYAGWEWGGCSDNVKIGNKMAKHYMDSKEHGRDIQAMINLHNNRVGRMMVKRNMRRMCKCHGVSGSCEMKTCWMRVQELKPIGELLKKAYDSAVPVEYNDNALIRTVKRRRHHHENSIYYQQRPKLPKNQLIYNEISPNYCVGNKTAGVAGVSGRQCSRRTGSDVSDAERASCKTLCRACGYNIQVKTVVVESVCKCKFEWCCDVKCKTCVEKVAQHQCV